MVHFQSFAKEREYHLLPLIIRPLDRTGLSRLRWAQSSYLATATGRSHCFDVDAEGVYEAIVIAVPQFCDDDVSPLARLDEPNFMVAVYHNPVRAPDSYVQVTTWVQHSMKDGPAG
jgi:hypothetical protein